MKKISWLLVLALVLTCAPITAKAETSKDQINAWLDEGYAVVEKVYDAYGDSYGAGELSTDQAGDYVSVFVYGFNVNKDTVKPVFYDDAGEVISGDVKAVEKTKCGAYFRIEKKDSDAWVFPNEASNGTKKFKVDVQSPEGKEIQFMERWSGAFNGTVDITRRDVFYEHYDQYRNTFTVYISSDINVDTATMPVIDFFVPEYDEESREYIDVTKLEITASAVKKEVNKFTGHEETRLVFELPEGFNEDTVDELFGNWVPHYKVKFVNKNTGNEEVYSTYEDNLSQPIGTVSRFQETRETDYVKGNRDVVLYYPYWVGGVYQFKDTGSDSKYYVSEAEAKELAEERFAYGEYTKGNGSLESGNMSARQYNFAYYVAADVPEAPVGKPVVKVTYKDGTATLTWNKIKNASGYYIAFDSGYGEKRNYREVTDTTFSESAEMLAMISMEMGWTESGAPENYGLYVIPFASNASGTITVKGECSDFVPIDPEAPETEEIASAKLGAEKVVYTGKAVSPAVTVKNAAGDTLKKGTDYKVTGVGTKVGRYTLTIEGIGKYAGTKKLTYTIVPKKPASASANLSTASGGYDDVKFTWKASTGASGYLVYYKKGTGSYSAAINVTGKTSYTKKNLDDGVKYTFKVVPYYKTASAATKYYNTAQNTTATVYTLKKIAAPTLSKSGTKVKVKWNNINGETGYQISKSTSKTGTSIVATYKTTSGTNKTVAATKGKKYYYKVRAYKVVNGTKVFAPWSAVKAFTRK